MVTWREALEGAARLAVCTAIDTVGNAADVFSNVFRPFPIGQRLQAFAAAARLICNDEPPDYDSQSQPFTGGQCDSRYLVTVFLQPVNGRWRDLSPGEEPNSVRPFVGVARGPISRVRAFRISPPNANQDSAWRGQVLAFPDSPSPPPPGTSPDWINIGVQDVIRGSGSFARVVNVTFQRAGGLPDNCGNPDPIIPPPEPNYNITNVNITYQNNDGLDITVPVTFFVGLAYLNASAQLEIPVNATFNANVSFPITFNLSTGDITFNFQPTFNSPDGTPTTQPDGSGGDNRRPDDFTFDNPPPPPPSGDEFDSIEPPENPRTERVIRGVGVTVTSFEPIDRGVIFQTGGNPDIYVPDLGMVQFQIRVGDSVFWTNNQRVLNQRAFIECPWEGGAIDVAGTPRNGVTWVLTPVYSRSELANSRTP